MRLLHRAAFAALVASGVLFSLTARADLHTWDINEIYSSADGQVQYIELQERMGLNGQHRLTTSFAFSNHTIKSNTKTFTFTSDLPSTITANKFFLIATPAFASAPGAVTPDYTFLPSQVPFFSISGDTLTFSNVDSFAFSGAQLPLNGHSALRDSGAVVENSPTNFAGQSGHLVVVGDMDADGDVDNFDILPFELALSNPADYATQFPAADNRVGRGDIDDDGDFDNFDILPFEALLTSSAPVVVPEPSGFVHVLWLALPVAWRLRSQVTRRGRSS